jgi:hypothetical protein
MSTGVGCTVLVDGVRLPDGALADDPLQPAAMSGLSVTWGRATTVDQPAMSSCTFDVLDLPGGQTFAQRIRTGSRVDVLAGGTVYPDDPTVSTFLDPGFATGTAATRDTNGRSSVVVESATTVRTNMVLNPSFDANINLWTTNAVTLTRDTSWAAVGVASGRVVTTGLTSVLGDIRLPGGGATSLPAGLLPGHTYTISAVCRTPAPHNGPSSVSTSRQRRVLLFVSTDGVAYTPTFGLQGPNIAGTFTVSLTFTLPADTTGVQLAIGCAGSETDPSFQTYVDAVLLEESPAVGTYFDGSTPDTATTDYRWTGSTNASTSTATTTGPGGTYLRMLPGDASRRMSVIVAPAPFSAELDAWDDIPTTSRGQVWSYGAKIRAPLGALVELRPVLIAGPGPGAMRVLDVPLPEPGDGAWHTVAGTFTPDADGMWVGIEISAFPVGPSWDDVDPALTWDAVTPTLTWDDYGAFDVDDVAVLAPASGTARTVDVFVGRVTDLEAAFDEGIGAAVVKVTAVDLIADMENRFVGDAPFPAETITARASRIVTLSGLPIPITIAPSLGSLVVSWRDVDRQGAFGLVAGLATSSDGVLWPAAHASTGSYLIFEDTADRVALRTLKLVGGLITVVNAGAVDAIDLSACKLLREPVRWVQSVSDVLTRTSVTWKEQGTGEDGNPTTTERTVTQIDAALESQYGTRAASVSSELTSSGDANEVASRLLSRTHSTDWRAQGLTLDDAWNDDTGPDDVVTLLDLLDGTRRIGAAVQLADMPGEWTPITGTVPVYVEGGTYTFTDAAWSLALTVSNSAGQGQSAAWNDIPATWTWDQWDPAITWNDLRGASAPAASTGV